MVTAFEILVALAKIGLTNTRQYHGRIEKQHFRRYPLVGKVDSAALQCPLTFKLRQRNVTRVGDQWTLPSTPIPPTRQSER